MNVGGTQITDAVYLIKNGAAAVSSIQLNNASTNETMVWVNTLAANAWVEFDSALQRARVSTNSGSSWTKTNTNMTGLIPKLQGGENNVITLTGPTTGTHNVTYTARG